MAKITQQDYLYSTTRVRALEKTLLTKERMERMMDAASEEDVRRILQDCGYNIVDLGSSEGIEAMLREKREETYSLLRTISPDDSLVKETQIPMDYHNLKVYLKAHAMGEDTPNLYSKDGRVSPEDLIRAIRQDRMKDLPEDMAASFEKAEQLLADTQDPQKMDFYLDQQCHKARVEAAKKTGIRFLEDLDKLRADSANLRILVRSYRLQKDPAFVKTALFEGGNVSERILLEAYSQDLAIAFSTGPLVHAAELGEKAKKGETTLTEFEKAVDNAQTEFLRTARRVSFGPEPLIAYLIAREEELKAVRTILTGRLYQVDPALTRERLREAYV